VPETKAEPEPPLTQASVNSTPEDSKKKRVVSKKKGSDL
jgi:hypothetical protein